MRRMTAWVDVVHTPQFWIKNVNVLLRLTLLQFAADLFQSMEIEFRHKGWVHESMVRLFQTPLFLRIALFNLKK